MREVMMETLANLLLVVLSMMIIWVYKMGRKWRWGMTKIAVNKILPNPEQPRKRFDKAELRELADSMQENGLVQAITVEAMNGDFILHDGERRWRAAKILAWAEIEANVQPPLNGTGRSDRLVRAMVANVQGADLDPLGGAQASRKMIGGLGMNKSEISRKTGKN